MGKDSKIEWTDHTWNPWFGCEEVSAGCLNCYAKRDMNRYGRDFYKVALARGFNKPIGWKKPARVFVCSWSDFFIEEADKWRPDAWAVIGALQHLTFQILTKRLENVASRLPLDWGDGYDNVWIGATVENQEMADLRTPMLFNFPAKTRFLSMEPLLGPVRINPNLLSLIDWVIVGGESGPNHRPMHQAWARSIRDQCIKAGDTYFFMKQMAGYSRQERQDIPADLLIREFPDA